MTHPIRAKIIDGEYLILLARNSRFVDEGHELMPSRFSSRLYDACE